MTVMHRIANAGRSLTQMFPGFYNGIGSTKHNCYAEFGYPDEVTFDHAYQMYCRNGIARSGCVKTAGKTWQDMPKLVTGDEIEQASDIQEAFDRLRVWQALSTADLRSLVGGYSGIIFRFADSKGFDQPVDRVPGGLKGLVECIPAWAGQLEVSRFDEDQTSPTYGKPLMYSFNEAAVGTQKNARSFQLHPDRVVIWSADGTINARSALEPGYNNLLDLEKIAGAGGEGFWKNAKSAPVLEMNENAKLDAMAKQMGVNQSELMEAMQDNVEDWQKGFDKLLLLQGIEAKTLGVTLPIPEHFFSVCLQVFAASLCIPLKVLVGSHKYGPPLQ